MKSNDYNYKHFGFKPYSEESTGRFLLERLEGPEIGTVAPDFTATTLDKKTVKLSDFRGKIVVLEMFIKTQVTNLIQTKSKNQ